MDIEEAILKHLSDFGPIAKLCGNDDGTVRVAPDHKREGLSNPCVTFSVITEPPNRDHSGAVALANPRVQIDAWAEDSVARRRLTEAVAFRMRPESNEFPTGFVVQDVAPQGAAYSSAWIGPGALRFLFRGRQDFIVWHEINPAALAAT